MQVTDEQIKMLIYSVVNELNTPGGGGAPGAGNRGAKGRFPDAEAAIAAAQEAQKLLSGMPLRQRADIIASIRRKMVENAKLLAEMAFEETGMGRAEDKTQKNLLAARKTPGPEDLQTEAFSGDHGLTLVERAPYGVIGSIIPSTNPTATVINNAISMISGGNAVVFNPHPGAKRSSCKAAELVDEASVEAGGPDNLVTAVAEPTMESGKVLMHHPAIRMLAVTGGPGIVRAALQAGKKTIAAGPGNPPVVVDATADLGLAAQSILDGAGFDNNLLCIAEKEVFAEDRIFDALMAKMEALGAYRLTLAQLDALMGHITEAPPSPGALPAVSHRFVGKSPRTILAAIGIDVPDSVRLAICEVPKDHPLVLIEQLMPILPLVRTGGAEEAIRLAHWAERGCHHTALMFSKDVARLTEMAKLLDTTIFVKNAPSFAGLGMGAEGFTTLTIATPTGEGLTSARSFTRLRRCVLKDGLRIV